MALQIVPYTAEFAPAVHAFNARLREGGISYQFPKPSGVNEIDGGPVAHAGPVVDREFVAVRDGLSVHGGYLIKERDYQLDGRDERIGFLGLPLSEGIIDKRFGMLGLQLITHALKRRPLLFGLGIGGRDESFARVIAALGWTMDPVPFWFKIVRPFRVARGLTAVRRTRGRRLAADVAAFTGVAALAAAVMQRGRRSGADIAADRAGAGAVSMDELASVADRTWADHRGSVRLAAKRDAEAVRRLYGSTDRPFLPYVVRRPGGETAWAVALDTAMNGHKHFGALRVGTIVDVFGHPDAAASLVGTVTRALAKRGVDLIVSNQSATVWSRAFETNGFLTQPSNYFFAACPALAQSLAPFDLHSLHLTRGDGEGPTNL